MRCRDFQRYIFAIQGISFGNSLNTRAWLAIIAETVQEGRVPSLPRFAQIGQIKTRHADEKAHALITAAIERAGIKPDDEPFPTATRILNIPRDDTQRAEPEHQPPRTTVQKLLGTVRRPSR